MTEKINYTIIIPIEHANERLDQVLARLLPDYSRTQLKTWIENGNILINNAPSKAKMKVKGGEEVSITAIPKSQPEWKAQPIPLNIVFEDEFVLIINKPIGLVVHPGAGNPESTLLNAILHHAPQLRTLPRAGILHRLDKDTSGLLIIAKTAGALKNLSHQLKKRTLVREYQAVVQGTMISGGMVDAPIARHHLQRKRMAIVETGKPAVTHYRVIEKFPAHTRLKLRLETGRTHQIRVHMTHIHHPIIGDQTYGGRIQLAKGMSEELIHLLRRYKRQALHAFAVGFTHPESGEFVNLEIDLPADIKELLEVLRRDSRPKE